jgi:hypothetical protein
MPDDWYEEGSVEDKVEWAEEWVPGFNVDINWLAEDIEPDVRAALARNKNIPITIIEKLAKSKEQQVRTALSMNPNTPKEILDKLKE